MKKKFILLITVVFFIMGIVTHILTFFGINILNNQFTMSNFRFMPIILPFISIIILIIIAYIIQKKKGIVEEGEKNILREGKNAPRWLLTVQIYLNIYVIANFIICLILLKGGIPRIDNGRYILNNHGVIKVLSELEYSKMVNYLTRFYSGVWSGIFFTLYINKVKILKKQHLKE